MATITQKQRTLREVRRQNVLENLRDIGAGTVKSLKDDLVKETSNDFFRQLVGIPESKSKYSGEIFPGQDINISEVFSPQKEEAQKFQKQVFFERQLHQEEKILIEQRGNELRLELHALIQEVATLAKTTQDIAGEVETASMQAPVNPGVYHINFFEKLLQYLITFRKNIQDAVVWLHATNTRAQKKNYWSTYKKKGGSFLLSPDHYLQRSAG